MPRPSKLVDYTGPSPELSPVNDLSREDPVRLWAALVALRLVRSCAVFSRHSQAYQALMRLAGPYLVWTADNLRRLRSSVVEVDKSDNWSHGSVCKALLSASCRLRQTDVPAPCADIQEEPDLLQFNASKHFSNEIFLDIRSTLDVLLIPDRWQGIDFEDFLAPAHRNPTTWRSLIDPAIKRLQEAHIAEPYLFMNVRFLQNLLDLSDEEAALLRVTALATEDCELHDLVCCIPVRSRVDGCRVLVQAGSTRENAAAGRLSPGRTRLHRLGILQYRGSCSDLDDLLHFDDGVGTLMLEEHHSPADLARSFLKVSPPATLSRLDYPHLSEELAMSSTILRSDCLNLPAGVNLLLYGAPGTGKTEFARLLASEAGRTLYEISFKGQSDDEPPKAMQRFAFLHMAQQFLKDRPRTLLVFDEAEDAFPSNTVFFGRERATPKAWMNELLETNAVPIVWISNSIEGIDRAYLRRFALHIEFSTQPIDVRRRIVEHHLGGVVPEPAALDAIASIEALPPAQIEMAARVIALSQVEDAGERARFAHKQIRMACRAMGIDMANGPRPHATRYDPSLVNLAGDYSAEEIIDIFQRSGQGSACFYGPPGTGKTALARHMADRLQRPLIARTASDLLSPYLGETEVRIRRMFEEAEDAPRPVVLLLDEADSFLGERRRAIRSWEISQTNEFLARIEAFSGIFVCTTNLYENLDLATLRRFTFKLEFRSLDAGQRAKMFEAEFGPIENEEAQHLLARLDGLTPGDYAVVTKQARMRAVPPPHLWIVRSLQHELAARGSQPRAIGFV